MKRKPISDRVAEYIQYKRNLGFKYRGQAYELKSFGRFADIHARRCPLTIKLALQWAILPSTGKPYHSLRLRILSGLAKFLILHDPQTELIPTYMLGSHFQRTPPYIYTQNEIVQLMTSIGTHVDQKLFNNVTLSSIIGLLVSTGMRIGEVLALNDQDIDWKQNALVIRRSKKLPMRLVPLNRSVIYHLKKYKKQRDIFFPVKKDNAFFTSTRGERYAYTTIRQAWARLRERTGIGKNEHRLPRLHDFRHTFACNHLLRAYKEKKNIDTAVHLLSVYLGHTSVKKTYWYLTGVPILLELVSQQVEKHIKSIRKDKTK